MASDELLREIIGKESGPKIENERYRLIPTRGRSRTSYVWGAEEAREAAEEMLAELDIPILVVHAPIGGLVRQLYTVGGQHKAQRRKAA